MHVRKFVNGFRLPLCLLGTITVLSLAGCNRYSGKSDYEKTMELKDGFGDLVKEMGGTAEYKYFNIAGQEGMAWVIDLNGAKFTPEQADTFIESLDALNDYVQTLKLGGSSITDEEFIRYDDQMHGRTVMTLDISNTALTDASVEKMDHFHCLAQMNATGTKITKQAVDKMIERKDASTDTPPFFKEKTKVKL